MAVKRYDAVVIGGGYAGLSSAALLAKDGFSVLLLEKKKSLGGRSSCYEQNGFIRQYGQHSHRLASEGHAAMLFSRLGMSIDFIKYSGDSYLYYKGGLCKRPEGLGDFLTTKILPFKSRLSFIKLYVKILKSDPNDWYLSTLAEFMKHHQIEPEAAAFASFLGMTVMLPDAEQVSAGEVIDFIQRAKRAKVKLGEPAGGAKQIMDKLSGFLFENGCQIKTEENAERIIVKNSCVAGVVTSKEEYLSDIVVYAAPLNQFPPLVEKNILSEGFINHCSSIKGSSGVVIDFVSRVPLTGIKGGIIGVDTPLWVKFQTNIDGSVAPEGYHVTTWGAFTDYNIIPESRDYQITEKKLRDIASVCMPGYEKKVESERVLAIPRINGVMLTPEQSKPRRAAIASDEIDSLYFTGDTVQGDGCSGDIAFSSAMKFFDIIKKKDTDHVHKK